MHTCLQSERKKYYDRLQEVFAEDQPIVFLYFRDALPVVASRVRGIIESPNGIRYKFNECIQTGLTGEIPVTGRHDLEDFRLTVDLIFRY